MVWLLFGQVFGQVPKPTPQQLSWHEDEYYWFLHFGPNTFTGKEWGDGKEKTEIFQPAQLDTDQWCRIAKAAGATGMIITAKHHDGFCLWPTAYSTHTVRESGWKGGKGDVLADLRKSCDKYGLKFGVYISPWDRNHPKYGTPEYNDIYDATLREVITKYGPIWEMWWDGANGEGPNGKKQVYDFPRFEKTVRSLSPSTVIFSDIGPDLRWIGNEQGFAGETNWNTLDTAGFKRGEGGPPTDTLNRGNRFGKHWIPGEVDVSIRPGWFYRSSENDKVRTPENLFKIYLESVGRGANLLLNVPPDDRGLIHERDSAAVMGLAALKNRLGLNLINGKTEKAFIYYNDNYQAAPGIVDGNASTFFSIPRPSAFAHVELAAPVHMNAITLRENLSEGQACAAFELELYGENNKLLHTIKGTTMGRKRILTFPATPIKAIRIHFIQQGFSTRLAEVEGHLLE